MRLIDADALIETMAIVAKKMARSDAQKALMGRVLYILEHKPEVVARCKDCKHRETSECPMVFYETLHWDDNGYIESETIIHDNAEDDGFCSYGERK